MDLFLRTYKHLLPKARAWSIIVEKILRQFFEGLTGLPADIKDFLDQIWLDLLPTDTRQIPEWEAQFGVLPHATLEADRRDALAAAWNRGGGQGPDTLEDVLRLADFDVYVHDPWVMGLGYTDAISCGEAAAACGEAAVECGDVVIRKLIHDPRVYIPSVASLLVNKVLQRVVAYVDAVTCGEFAAACGEAAAECGDNDGFTPGFKVYVVPNDRDQWPYFWYIGGVNFGDVANVPLSRKDEFETLILKIGPSHVWAGLFINYV